MGYARSPDYWGSQIPRLVDYGLHKRLTVRSIKLFADGALGSWGAALIAPYDDKPDTLGLLLATPKTLHQLAEQFYEDHFQVVRTILAAFGFPIEPNAAMLRTFMPLVTAQTRLCLTSLKIF
jgi:hypothetical protein